MLNEGFNKYISALAHVMYFTILLLSSGNNNNTIERGAIQMVLNYTKEQVKDIAVSYSTTEGIFGKSKDKMLAEDLLQVYQQLDDCQNFYPMPTELTTNSNCSQPINMEAQINYKKSYEDIAERFNQLFAEHSKHLDEFHHTKNCLHTLENENKKLLDRVRTFKQR